MKNNILFLTFFFLVVAFSACKKDKTQPSDEANSQPLVYTSLIAQDTSILVGVFVTISATATGDELTYTWSSDYGSFLGSGASVQWVACHAADHVINCEVKDKYNNSATKSVVIHVY
ncbi:MAG: hypothetical protein WC868_11185 [Bacteroidales bacterium]